jgi:4-hydroxybenzoate polyprenyltransferase
MKSIYYLFKSMRPDQWTKNGFVLLPLIFARKVFEYPGLMQGLTAFGIFCLLSSAMYLFNDISDLDSDRHHPIKRRRPLAAGLISVTQAKWSAAVLLLCALSWALVLGKAFFSVVVIYATVQIAYTHFLKNVVIVDIFCISAGFFLRVIGGAAAVDVVISNWLIICTISIAMFLTLGKRRNDLTLIGQGDARRQRKVFSEYTPYLLDQMIGIVTATTLLSYMLYCISPETIAKFQTRHLIYTFPFVLYGLFRYLYLIHAKEQGGSPERVLLTDPPLLASVVLWGLCAILIIYGVI